MRRGFALLSVVLLLTGGAAVALAALTLARRAIRATENRIALTRNGWRAEDCAARALAAIDALVRGAEEAGSRRGPMAPDTIAAILERAPAVVECPGTVTLRPAGLQLPLNVADGVELRGLFSGVGLAPGTADSLADAILDWRDADDAVRAMGCERACYDATGGAPPRNDRFAHVMELESVRGFASADSATAMRTGSGLRGLFSVDDDRVSMRHAAPVVLAALPGIGVRGAAAIERRRRAGPWRPSTLQQVGAELPAVEVMALTRAMAALETIATVEPAAWILDVRSPRPASGVGASPNESTLELRLRLGADGASLIRRSTGP